MLLLALETGNKIGIAVVAAVFIAFALFASFVAPRRWPDFPGKNGMSVFLIASIALFAGMLATIGALAKESHAEGVHQAAAHSGKPAHEVIAVKETEYRIALPALRTLPTGEYTFEVHNDGTVEHDLVIEGPRVAGENHTPVIPPGGKATLTVSLGAGTYTLYCAVDNHRRLGMLAKITVG